VKTWRDDKGREWTIRLTLDLADRVLASTKVDLIPDDNDLRAVLGLCFQNRKLAAVLWECSKDAAKEEGIDKAAFLDSLDGSALVAGWEALKNETQDFIEAQNPKIAELVRAASDAHLQGMEQGLDMMIEEIRNGAADDAMKAAVQQIRDEMHQALANIATGSPE